MTYLDGKALLRAIQLQAEYNKVAHKAEEEYETQMLERYLDEHPLDGNTSYARMQSDSGQNDPDVFE